ncbi:MAG: lipid-A-disaccharide synthase [Saprospiraceae bacterium]
MKYFILAGEASGDKQAALLCASIYKYDSHAILKGWGGEAMSENLVEVTKHYRDLAFMGFVEVIKHLPVIFKNFRLCKNEIMEFQPDALILVDYPGFNLRMASWAFKKKIPVYYYISPQLWAWHTSRVHKIRQAVRRMYVILPFEQAFYKKYNVDALYIGHPLAKGIRELNESFIQMKPGSIALLPGSRKHEIELILPEMAGLAKLLPDFTFNVVCVQHIPVSIYREIIGDQKNISLVDGKMQMILQESEAAIVTSGTATLETALIGTPQVVVYKGNPLSYRIAKRLVKVPYISLVNLIVAKELVPELIQDQCNALTMKHHLLEILKPEKNQIIRKGYEEIQHTLLSGGGPDAAAEDIVQNLTRLKG